ncbi:MAG: trypsin-like peptidase domain-containing protein, partial [Bacteroidota bacterium]
SKGFIHTFVAVSIMVGVSGCATLFIPAKQKITIQTNNDASKVYIDNDEVGEGENIETKVKKNGTKQVVVQTPEYKNEYLVLSQTSRRPIAYWPLVIIDWCTFYGGLTDAGNGSKFHLFPKQNKMEAVNKLTYRKSDEKYIDLDAVKIKVSSKEKDLKYYSIYASQEDFFKEAKKAEDEREKADKKQADKDAKKKVKVKGKLNAEESKLDYDDSKFSESILKTLKQTNFIDTVNKVFSDNNNTLKLEGIIRKASLFYSVTSLGSYKKVKVNITWNIKNSYNEIVDSINFWSWSGDFIAYNSDESYKMYADAVDISYFELLKNKQFQQYLKMDTVFAITEPILKIKLAQVNVKEIDHATTATVIIKRKDGGHGSGFAISNDGYILTNYHVIAGKNASKQSDISVIMSDGEEVSVSVVRYNKMRDIALLKVEKGFETPFILSNTKSYKKLMEVYTVGTPKSIELGQSVSIGLLSNERKANNNSLLQLSMSINPGNSGGPLFDKAGNLHGIVTSKLVGYATEGVGFAIPAYLAMEYLNLEVK